MPIKWLSTLFQRIRYYRKKLLPFAVGALVVLVPLVIITIKNANQARAEWYNDNWLYRTRWVFTENTTAITAEREVEFTVDTASLITDGKLQSDCDDLRFTNINGDPLPYDITGTCDDASTTIDVLYPEIIVGDTVTFMYYGNNTAFVGEVSAAFGATVYTPDSGPTEGSEVQSVGPAMYLKFDSGSTSTAEDYTQQSNDGSITNATIAQQDLCLLGLCVGFDGDGDYIQVSDDSTLDSTASDGLTVQAWFKHSLAASGTQTIVEKYESTGGDGGYVLRMESDSDISFGVDDANNDYADDLVTSTLADYDDGNWHFAVGVKDGTTGIYLYIDGVLVASDTTIGSTGSLANNDDLYIGIAGDGAANDFNGYIDEVKVYPYARTSNEIKTDLVKGFTLHGASAVVGQESSNTIGDSLIGYWTMNETQSVVAEDRLDTSGNDSTLSDATTTPHLAGQYKKAASFEGSDYLYAADNSTLSVTGSMSISAWIYPGSVTGSQSIVGKWDTGGAPDNESYLLELNGDELRFYVDGSSDYQETDAANLSTSTWYFVVVLYDASAQTVTFYINGEEEASTENGTIPSSISDEGGRFHVGAVDSSSSATNFYTGRVDELRLYARVLSEDEISTLYVYSPPPVAYLPLNDSTGTTAVDVSGNGFNGTLTNMDESSWINGVYGKGLVFVPPSDYVVIPTNGVEEKIDNLGPFTVAMWIRPDANNANRRYFDTGANRIQFYHGGSSNIIVSINHSSGSIFATMTANTLVLNTWQHLAITWDGENLASGVTFFVDGVAVGTQSSTDAGGIQLDDGALNKYIGNGTGGLNRAWDGGIDDVRIYDYIRTQSQIIQDLNGRSIDTSSGSSSTTDFTSQWLFDTQYGDTAYDSNLDPNVQNHGDLAGSGTTCPNTGACPTWTNSGKQNGALDFDGSDDYVDVSADVSIDLNGKDSYSMCAWINPDSDGEGDTGEFISKGSTYLGVSSESGGEVNVTANIDLATTDATITSVRTIPINEWSHVCFVWGLDELSLYINGLLDSTNIGSGSPADDSSSDLNIGGDSTDNFDGTIDSVRIFTSTLTTAQVKTDYNNNSSLDFGSSVKGTNDVLGGVLGSPILHWTFNEHTGTTVGDISTAENTGVTESGTPTWDTGKYGSSLYTNSDGAHLDDDAAFDNLSNLTVMAWIKKKTDAATSGNYQRIVTKLYNDGGSYEGSWGLLFNDGERIVWSVNHGTNWDSSPDFSELWSDSSLEINKWYHIAVTYDGSEQRVYINGVLDSVGTDASGTIPAGPHCIFVGYSADETSGCETNTQNRMDGWVDDLKVFDVTLTPAQIAWHYNQGNPYGWWKFDECQGTDIYDSGTGENNASLTVGGSGSITDTGYCGSGTSTDAWHNGDTAIYGGSIELDDTDSYIDVGDIAHLDLIDDKDMSLTGWFYRDTASTDDTIVAKRDSVGASSSGYALWIDDSTDDLNFEVSDGNDEYSINSTSTFTSGSWNYFAITWDDDSASNTRVFINGVLDQDGASGTIGNIDSPTAPSVNFRVGAESDGGAPFDGRLDDIRYYPFVLSEHQIKRIMEEAGVNFR